MAGGGGPLIVSNASELEIDSDIDFQKVNAVGAETQRAHQRS